MLTCNRLVRLCLIRRHSMKLGGNTSYALVSTSDMRDVSCASRSYASIRRSCTFKLISSPYFLPNPCCQVISLRNMASGSAQEASAVERAGAFAFKAAMLGLVTATGLQVLPGVGDGAIAGAVRLLDAQKPLLVSAGCSRLKQFAGRNEHTAQVAVDNGAIPKLLTLLHRHVREDISYDVISVLHELSLTDVGLEALRQRGAEVSTALQCFQDRPTQMPSEVRSMVRELLRRSTSAQQQHGPD